MRTFFHDLWTDEAGFLISAELVLIATIGVIGIVAGMSHLRGAVVEEYQDVGESLRSLNQSYSYSGFRGCKSFTAGSDHYEDQEQAHVDFPEVYEERPTLVPPVPKQEIVEEKILPAPCTDCPPEPHTATPCCPDPKPHCACDPQPQPCPQASPCHEIHPCPDPCVSVPPPCEPMHRPARSECESIHQNTQPVRPSTQCDQPFVPAPVYRGAVVYGPGSYYGGAFKTPTGYNTRESIYNTRRYYGTPNQWFAPQFAPRSSVW